MHTSTCNVCVCVCARARVRMCVCATAGGDELPEHIRRLGRHGARASKLTLMDLERFWGLGFRV